jgi:hypothetical protein
MQSAFAKEAPLKIRLLHNSAAIGSCLSGAGVGARGPTLFNFMKRVCILKVEFLYNYRFMA